MKFKNLFCENPFEEDEQTSYRVGKIFAKYISNKGLVSRIHKEFSKLNRKKKHPTRKWTKNKNRHFTEEDI